MSAGLKDYNAKRNFSRTSEPSGKSIDKTNRKHLEFVIQKHHARRLHFDLRLEMDGVLKSWALTKGPSLDPREKRLAVQTEDHPLAYARFEGTIPEGEYGAGEVIIWDRGIWQELPGSEGLKAGHLKFRLQGERLNGGFALVRMKPDNKRTGSNKTSQNWLLVKERDGTEKPGIDPIQVWTGSVGPKPSASPKPTKRAALSRPEPQLATSVEVPPGNENWVHEIKYDGYRLLACKWADEVRLWTRNGKDWTARLPTIAKAVQALPAEHAVLDGELVVLDNKGRSDFSLLQADLKGGGQNTHYMVFDLLQLGMRDLRDKPWHERKGELTALLYKPPDRIQLVEHLEADGLTVFEQAARLGAEGIVSKHRLRPYKPVRNRHWLKSKAERRGVFIIGGYRKSSSKHRAFSSLLLGQPMPDGTIKYCGRVGTGFSGKQLSEIAARFKTTPASPFTGKLSGDATRDAVWLRPDLAAEIAFADRTRDGHLRHPKFRKLVRKSKTETMAKSFELTSAERLLFPDVGLTKSDLLEYLRSVAHDMLPYIRNRPLSFVRSPKGGYEDTFFQRHHRDGMPKTILRATPDGAMQPAMLINDVAGLEAAAQFSVMEFHIRGAKARTIGKPDRLVMDLDPDQSLDFKAVRSAARLVRDVLSSAGLGTFPLLTGGKGIHVIAPLNETQDWDTVKQFSRTIATELAKAEPSRFTAKKGAANRRGKIFLDWQRNLRSATAIAPFSPRARPGAPVATPISWKELSRISATNAYSMETIAARLVRLRNDPWDGYFELDQDVPDLTNAKFSGL